MKSIVKHILLIPCAVLAISGVVAKTTGHPNHSLTSKTARDTGSNLNSGNSATTAIILHGSLVNFGAAYGRNFFDLNWNTIAEQNCDHFDIERSTNGDLFEKVGEVRKDNHDENYFFRDNVKPSLARKNDLYYRLKQVDVNGDFTYSKVLIARMYNTRTLAALSVTPDPVMNDILVNVQLKMRSWVVIRLNDKAGNRLMEKSIQANDEFNTYKLDGTHALDPGTYSLEVIINSNERMEMKLVKG